MHVALYHNLPSGGAKRVTFEQVSRLAQRGYIIDEYVLSTAEHDFLPFTNNGQKSYVFQTKPFQWFNGRIPFLTPYIHAWQGYARQNYLDRLTHKISQQINDSPYDLVFVTDCQFTTIPFVLQHIQKPTVFYMHSLPLSRQSERVFENSNGVLNTVKQTYFAPAYRSHITRMRRIDRQNLNATNKILINSNYASAWMMSHYGLAPQVVYPGIDVDKFRPTNDKTDDFVLSVGSLTSGKGYLFIIMALSEIPAEKRPKFIIAANFIDHNEAQAVNKLAQLKNVQLEIRSVKNDTEMVRLYNQAIMLLFAPYNEPLGLAALESMACGTPVVGVKEGGLTETIVDGLTGILVDRDPKLFANAITQLLNQSEQRKHLGSSGVEHIRTHWTWDRAIDSLEEIFTEISA